MFVVHSRRVWSRVLFSCIACLLALAPRTTWAGPLSDGPPRAAVGDSTRPRVPEGDVTGTVTDSTNGHPLAGVDVIVSLGNRTVATAATDAFGRFIVHHLSAGTYLVFVRSIGFRPQSKTAAVGAANAPPSLVFHLTPAVQNLEAVAITASAPVAVDTRTGNQVFKQSDYHGAPTSTTSQILQQSIVGSVRAPTGEVHIRGQHAEYTYYIDGVPVPAGISGSLNELFDPSVVNRIEFQTGGWDAEYGNKNAAVVNVQTRIPAGGFKADVSSYAGTFNANGQTLNVSDNAGKLGWFLSGTRQVTNMRREPILFDTLTLKPINFHNHGEDLFGFGKLQYTPSNQDAVSLDMNWARTRSLVPYDSSKGTNDDRQEDINSFLNLGWRHAFGAAAAVNAGGAELFTGLFYRHGGLTYTPGTTDQPSFIFFPDTTPYNLREDRTFDTYGLKLDYEWRANEQFTFKMGTLVSSTSGHELFVTTGASGQHGPESSSALKGSDAGGYVQTVVSPVEWFELRTGVRYDAHTAPFAGTQSQVSPRVKLSFFPDAANTVFLYYGRLFMPTNVEDLRSITSAADSGVVTAPTLPERDQFFEAGLMHRFDFGVVAKVSGYYKESTPGIDDNTVPGSNITTSVNLAKVYIRGLEGVLEVRPVGSPLTGYLNVAVNHAYGRGPVTGGFFATNPADVPGGWFDLDHDQRVSVVGSAVYSEKRFFLSATGIYGSGLTNGVDQTQAIGRGLLDFNRFRHVDPNFILNASTGYSFVLAGAILRPEIYVDNVLDKRYLLKGAFFSGASVGRPRSVQLRVNVGM